jgi:hypothetical protein
VDLIDGTPVYDIKPYLPYAEALPDAAAGFAGDEIPRLEVEITDGVMEVFHNLPERSQALIREALALDPRPAVQADDADRTFGALLCGHNVRFKIADGVCRIVEIGRWLRRLAASDQCCCEFCASVPNRNRNRHAVFRFMPWPMPYAMTAGTRTENFSAPGCRVSNCAR